MSPLRQRMIQLMQLKRFSPKTQESYLRAMVGLAEHYHQSPDQLSEQAIHDYLLYLAKEKNLFWSSCNVAASAMMFFYNQVLGERKIYLKIPKRKTPKQLPEVLSQEEVERLLSSCWDLKRQVFLTTVYSAGLRLGESTRLRVGDIDSSRMMIRIEQGKGAKDRYTVLAERTLTELREYYRIYRPLEWLFFGRNKDRPLPEGSAQKWYYEAKRKAGITKKGGIHCLRHCFATHLLEDQVDVKTIQRMMGHNSLKTTSGYLHITQKRLSQVRSPLDELYDPQPSENRRFS